MSIRLKITAVISCFGQTALYCSPPDPTPLPPPRYTSEKKGGVCIYCDVSPEGVWSVLLGPIYDSDRVHMIRDAKLKGKPVCVQDYLDEMPMYFIDKKGRLEQTTFSSTENKAAIGIQSGLRGHMARKTNRKLKQLEGVYAIKLQRQYRRHLVQKEIIPILQKRRQMMKVAIKRNLLISVPGTQQGQTGWYTSPKKKGYVTRQRLLKLSYNRVSDLNYPPSLRLVCLFHRQ